MDQKSLIDKICASADISRENAVKLFDAFIDEIGSSCGNLDSIAIPGFGQFEGKKRDERIAVHPASGRRMLVPPRITVGFKPSALLKQKIK